MSQRIEIDITCRQCQQRRTYSAPRVRGNREAQDNAIERHLRRCGWSGGDASMFVCAACSNVETSKRRNAGGSPPRR